VDSWSRVLAASSRRGTYGGGLGRAVPAEGLRFSCCEKLLARGAVRRRPRVGGGALAARQCSTRPRMALLAAGSSPSSPSPYPPPPPPLLILPFLPPSPSHDDRTYLSSLALRPSLASLERVDRYAPSGIPADGPEADCSRV
jgi:hypothetical protein